MVEKDRSSTLSAEKTDEIIKLFQELIEIIAKEKEVNPQLIYNALKKVKSPENIGKKRGRKPLLSPQDIDEIVIEYNNSTEANIVSKIAKKRNVSSSTITKILGARRQDKDAKIQVIPKKPRRKSSSKKRISKRNIRIVSLYTNPPYPILEEVADIIAVEFNEPRLTRERVRQILEKNNVKSHTKIRTNYRKKRVKEQSLKRVQELLKDPDITINLVFDLFVNQRLAPSVIAETLGVTLSDFKAYIEFYILPFKVHSNLGELEAQLISEAMENNLSLRDYMYRIYVEENQTTEGLMKRYRLNAPTTLFRLFRKYKVEKRPNRASKNTHIKMLKKFMKTKGYNSRKKFLEDYSIVPRPQLAKVIGIPPTSLSSYCTYDKIKSTYPRNWMRQYQEPLLTDEEITELSTKELQALAAQKIKEKTTKTKS